MAITFHDLELLMDHNLALAAASSRLPTTPSSQPNSSPPPPPPPPHHHHPECLPPPPLLPPSLASLSLAFGPLLSPPILSNPALSSPRIPSRPPQPSPALPSQKKCISPLPLMPAVSAVAAAGMDAAAASPSSGSGRSSKFSTAFPDYQRLAEKRGEFGEPSNGAAMRRASIVWFRNDLRIHDNEALLTASKESLSVLPVFCFDPRDYGKSSSGFDKTGPYRANFLLECVSNLRYNLRELGSDLVVRVGKPEEVLVGLAKNIGADALYTQQEISSEEIQCESKVSAVMQQEGVDVKYFWGSTLYHKDDLPFKLEQMPITFLGFRETLQKVDIRKTVETPKELKGLPVRGGVKPGDIPTLQELGVKAISAQRQEGQTVAPSLLVGGETEALRRVKSFAVDHITQLSNKAAGNVDCGGSLYGSNFPCKISPWLVAGCLSPRHLFEELKNHNTSKVSTSSSVGSNSSDTGLNLLVFELLWRDFFRFITKKYSASKQGLDVITATPSTPAVPA